MSSRIVWPYAFTLQASQQDRPQSRPSDFATAEVNANPNGPLGLPIDLRWVTLPYLGIPRQPFEVFRRARINIPAADILELTSAPVQVNGSSIIPFPAASAGVIYIAAFEASPSSGNVLIVAPYDMYGKTIPGVVLETDSTQVWYFICPGMAGLRVDGFGTISLVVGVNQETYANLPGWERIQVVGLPVETTDNLAPAYNSSVKQGFDIALTTGILAARERMALSHLFLKPPPATGDPTFPLPAWPPSNPAEYLLNLRSGTNLFPMIVKCLQNSNDTNPTQMQSLYMETVNNLDGIIQANAPAGSNPSPAGQSGSAEIPVVSLSMLGVSTDSDAALALGYGTIDIPLLDEIAEVLAIYAEYSRRDTQLTEQILLRALAALAAIESRIPYDYMVTAPYVLPFGITLTLAALSQPVIPVEQVADFNASILSTHAVLTRDTGAEVAVELTWSPATQPQAAGILVSRQSGQSQYLNTPRPAAVHGYDPYLGLPPTQPPPNASPSDLLPNLKDANGTAPLDGSTTTRYLAAGIDVFGRWSPWTEADMTLSAAAVTGPGLGKISLIPPVPSDLPSSGTKVQYLLQIEVLWNWVDRSPGSIAISGNFVPPGTNLGPTAFLNALGMNNDTPAGPPLVLTWNYSGYDPTTVAPGTILPIADAAHPGTTIVLLNDVSNVPNNQVMHYQVTIPGFSLDFASTDEIALALYATATERVRPGEWSSPIDPNAPPSPPAPAPGWIGRVVTAPNPLPPVVTFNPPAIDWTALPDAYNLAHGVLSWPAASNATGYVVWEATESALLQLLSPGSPNPAPAPALLVDRGATLKTLVKNNFAQSLQAFSRLNTDPIPTTSMEVEVPGNASVLYCYMISAVSSQSVESTRTAQNSPIAVFGVPQRIVPGQPRLRLRSNDNGIQPPVNGVQVIALAVSTDFLAADAIPLSTKIQPGDSIVAGYRVYRCRSAALAADAGLMGPAVYFETDPRWSAFTESSIVGKQSDTGMSIIDSAAIASWYPWYYRVQAIGVQDIDNGFYSGKSLPSQVQSAYNLPPNPPLISPDPPAVTQGSGAALVNFTADLPIPASPLGASLVELLKAAPDPANPGRTIYNSIVSNAPDAITVGTLVLPVPPWTPPHPMHPPGHPPPYHPPFLGPALARSAPNAQGQFTLSVLVPYAASDKNTYTVRLTDPLGRQNSFTF